jgi:hypothetical protein
VAAVGDDAMDCWFVVDWWQAVWTLLRTGGQSIIPDPADQRPVSLNQLRSKALASGYPLILLLEGTSSNGRALLKPLVDDATLLPGDLHLLGIRYTANRHFTPAYSAGNTVWYTLQLCGQLFSRMQVLYLPDEELRLAGDCNYSAETDESPLTVSQLMESMARLLRQRRTQLTAIDKRLFLEALYQRKRRRPREE